MNLIYAKIYDNINFEFQVITITLIEEICHDKLSVVQ